jgi:sugar phosphate permease
MPEKRMNRKVGVVSALWFMVLVNYLDRVAIGFAGPAIMMSLSMTPAKFGIVLSSFGIGYLLAQIPGGVLADRWGGKVLLVAGPILWAVFTGATALVATIAGFVFVRVCFGISEGLSNTSLYKTIGDNFESKQRARALAICTSAIPLAPAFAGALVGRLIGAYGWQKMFLLMTAPAVLSALVSYLLIPASRSTVTTRSEVGSKPEASFGDVLRRPSLWVLSLAAFSWNIPYWGYLGWMPSYLALGHHIDLKSIGALAGIPYIFAFFGMLLGGWLGSTMLHRYCPQLVIAFFVGAGLSLFLAYQAVTLPLTLTGLSSAAFFLFGTSGPIGKIVLDLAPERTRASYVGVYNTAGQLGGAVAPGIIGFLVSATGSFATGFGFMIGALCVGAGCIAALMSFLDPKPRLQVVAV